MFGNNNNDDDALILHTFTPLSWTPHSCCSCTTHFKLELVYKNGVQTMISMMMVRLVVPLVVVVVSREII